MIVFLIVPFLLTGSIAYLLCAAVPRLRRFAMPSSLWLLSLCIGLYIWVSIILGLAIGRDLWNAHVPQLHLWLFKDFTLPQTKGFTIACITALIATCFTLASIVTVIHQAIVHRVTLALFRLYVAAISLGVGITFFLPVFLGMAANVPNAALQTAAIITAAIAALASATAVAFFCFHRSSQFRGSYPDNFPIATREEFYFVDPSPVSRPDRRQL